MLYLVDILQPGVKSLAVNAVKDRPADSRNLGSSGSNSTRRGCGAGLGLRLGLNALTALKPWYILRISALICGKAFSDVGLCSLPLNGKAMIFPCCIRLRRIALRKLLPAHCMGYCLRN